MTSLEISFWIGEEFLSEEAIQFVNALFEIVEEIKEKVPEISAWEMIAEKELFVEDIDWLGKKFVDVDADESIYKRFDPNCGPHFPLLRKEHWVPPQAIV